MNSDSNSKERFVQWFYISWINSWFLLRYAYNRIEKWIEKEKRKKKEASNGRLVTEELEDPFSVGEPISGRIFPLSISKPQEKSPTSQHDPLFSEQISPSEIKTRKILEKKSPANNLFFFFFYDYPLFVLEIPKRLKK